MNWRMEIMKRLYTLLVLLTIVVTGWAVDVDGIHYKLISGPNTAMVTYGTTKYTGEVTIPSSFTYNGTTYLVTIIGKGAFENCSNLTYVAIPNTVTVIKEDAFSGCSSLTSMAIPNSVITIEDDAFCHCSNLISLHIPNSVTSIGEDAFYGCSSLTSIFIPNSVTSIGAFAFHGCSNLTSIKVESGNPEYDSRNNWNCLIETNSNTLLKGINTSIIPNTVTSIGERAFEGCNALFSLTIPNSVTNIGERAFDGCSNLTSLTIGNSVVSIGEYAFAGCDNLNSVTNLSTTPQKIYPYSYTFRTYGTLHVLPGCGDAYRAASVWNNFTIMEDAIAPVTASGDCGEYGDNVKWCYYEESKKLIISGSGAMANFSYDNTPWYSFRESIESIEIQSGVKSIGDRAFYDCTGLTSLIIPNSVTSIGHRAFYYCIGLTSVTIPSSVTSIGSSAFSGCM